MNDNETQRDPETAEDLQSAINELQKRLVVAQDKEMGENVEKVKMPVANGFLRLSKFSSVPIKAVTPAEVAILVAEHHTRAGGMPIEHLTKTGEIEVDPRAERARLLSKYHPSKVKALFPGLVPAFPKSFRSAMESGLSVSFPSERLMDFQLEPFNSGAVA